MYKYHKDGVFIPEKLSIFVFGSNLKGIHGAGAAKFACHQLGAVYGVGIGITGRCYAIPTKDKHIMTLSLDVVKFHVDNFINYAKENIETNFFITRIGCGLAGYSDNEIAPLFKNSSENCNFAEEWKQYLEL